MNKWDVVLLSFPFTDLSATKVRPAVVVSPDILRDDGLSYGDYVEQLTFLLFLKMADEEGKPPFNKPSPIPRGFGWDAQAILQKAFSGRLATAEVSG